MRADISALKATINSIFAYDSPRLASHPTSHSILYVEPLPLCSNLWPAFTFICSSWWKKKFNAAEHQAQISPLCFGLTGACGAAKPLRRADAVTTNPGSEPVQPFFASLSCQAQAQQDLHPLEEL